MKICLLGPVYPYRGGIAHFTTQLAKKLIEEGHDVLVISFKSQYPAWLYPGKSDKDTSPGRQIVDALYLLSPLNPLTWGKTIRVIKRFEPDKIILPWWVTFWAPAFRHLLIKLKRSGFRTTVLIHNTYPHEARVIDKWIVKKTLQHADRFVVMTEKEKERLLDVLPDIVTVAVVPHPIYQNFPATPLSQSQAREKLGLPLEVPLLLFFGFVRPYKGLSDLIKALKALHEDGSRAHLVVAGEFWGGREEYDRQIADLGLINFVHIHDHYIPDDEVYLFFHAADLFVAPYTGGTQSGALKAAFGFGLPSVVTELVADEIVQELLDICVVVPPSQPHLLANSLKNMLTKVDYCQRNKNQLFDESWQKFCRTLLSE